MTKAIAKIIPFLCVTLPARAFAQTALPMTNSCANPLRVNFWGDFFVDARRLEKSSLDAAKPLISWAHFNVVNFEGNIGDPKKLERAFPSFPYALAMPTEAIGILKKAGVMHATRANNHTMDFGAAGMRQTSKALHKQGIAWAGAGENSREAIKPLSLSQGNTRVAVISFATTWPKESWANSERAGIAYPTLERLELSIKEARSNHDFVALSFHWGAELETELRPYQHGLVDAAFHAGADLIYGHHAHMAQGIEMRNRNPLAWGLGNFLFSAIGKSTNMSLAMHTEFCKSENEKSINVVYTPIETGSEDSQTSVIPLSRERFMKLSARHRKEKIIDPKTRFFILDEGKTMTLEDWLKPTQNPAPAQNPATATPPPS